MDKKSLLIGSILMGVSACALALSGDSDFSELYSIVKGWSEGYLGATIALAFLLVGLGMGVIGGRIIGAITCIAAAVALVIGPTVVEGIFTLLI